jgi:quercetin dioxygenase-like cupin family protein
MRHGIAALVVVTALTAGPAYAQNAPARPAATRTVIAATKLPTVVEKPLFFRATGITLQPGTTETISGGDGVVYQTAGSIEITVGSTSKALSPGDGIFIGTGTQAVLAARGNEPSYLIHFALVPASAADQGATGSGAAKELYRTAQPLPGLKSGPYELNLTRVTFPAQMPSNPPHHRSGGALYYVISGTGANTVEGKTEMRRPGTFIYEPAGLVHQWGNPGNEPLTFVTLNINQEGVPAVVPEAPPKSQ